MRARKIFDTILHHRELRNGILLLCFLLIVAIFAPAIATHNPRTLYDDLLAPPSARYLFGTDDLGRDVFSRVVYGTRTSLKIGVTAALISTVIGTLIGAISGYFGGIFDKVMSELINVFLMTPTFFLILIIVALYGSSLTNVILVIGFTSWTRTARIMRGQAIALKERTFVKSAITIGESRWSILFKHIIPHGIYPIISDASMAISGAILYEASLSFLGLGDPESISWGQLIYHGKGYLINGWWITTFAGLGIVLTVLSFHLISEGINRAMNPTLVGKKEGV